MSSPITVSDEAVEAALTAWSGGLMLTTSPRYLMRAALEAAAPFMHEAPAPLSQVQPAPSVTKAQFPRVWDVVEEYRRRHEGPGDPSLPSCEVCEMLRALDRALASTPEGK
jgi:hypothetical protein